MRNETLWISYFEENRVTSFASDPRPACLPLHGRAARFFVTRNSAKSLGTELVPRSKSPQLERMRSSARWGAITSSFRAFSPRQDQRASLTGVVSLSRIAANSFVVAESNNVPRRFSRQSKHSGEGRRIHKRRFIGTVFRKHVFFGNTFVHKSRCPLGFSFRQPKLGRID